MAISTRIVTLSDAKKAVEITGLEAFAVYARARVISKQTVERAGGMDVAIIAEAYQVDLNGAEISRAPAISRTLNGAALAQGSITLETEQISLRKELLEHFVAFYQAMKSLGETRTEMIE